MNKLIKNIAFPLVLIIISVNCGCAPSATIVQTAIAQTQSVRTPTLEVANTPTPEPLPTLKPTNTLSQDVITSLNRIYRINGFCEFQIDEIVFSKKILPPNTNGFYTYYESTNPNSTYLDIVVSIKNIDTKIKSVDDFANVSAIYDNKYKYVGSAILVDSQGGFALGFYGIEPLLTGVVHYLVEVPNEVEYSSKSLEIVMRVTDQEFHYKYR